MRLPFLMILWYYSNHCMEIARGSGVAEIVGGLLNLPNIKKDCVKLY